jgi:hypothetical protein
MAVSSQGRRDEFRDGTMMPRWIVARPGRELLVFAVAFAALVSVFFHETLFEGKILSPADVLFVSASFREVKGADYEPYNRLLIDPVLQFQPWIEFNRRELRAGRVPLWNPYVGCGAPHLANGQSAVFDPFHAIAYLGRLPDAHAWMAAARLWVAGIGMFLLARYWGLRPWGRWFAGLVYPFSGFLVGWLLYPVTSVAAWFPWTLWASDRVLDRPRRARVALMCLIVGCCLLGGHVQTSAHVLLAAGLNLLWRWRSIGRRPLWGWMAGLAIGVGIAAVQIIPLGDYLTKSPVWTDRAIERKAPWAVVRPRILETVCTALPYAFGSQRRGHPNLARGLGVQNVNESAGGFAGLATLIWLAPLAWSSRRDSRVRWLFALTALGALASGRWPPIDNLLRAIPVLSVTDNRRLSLWVALGLSLLGGIGLDRLGATRRGGGWAWWARAWLVGAGICALAAVGIGRFEPRLRAMARAHYDRTLKETPGADAEVYRRRADRQTRDTLVFVPRYYGLAAVHLAGLAGWVFVVRSRRVRSPSLLRAGLLGVTLVDLFGFGLGLNPAIDRDDDRPLTPLIAYLRKVAPPPTRVLGVGEELPPNVAMRYGLADVRNYDSVELASSVDYFASLYPPGDRERTSRRTVTWAGVLRARDRLHEAGVGAIVAATPPPEGAFAKVEKVGSVWVALTDPGPYAAPGPLRGGATPRVTRHQPGIMTVDLTNYERASNSWNDAVVRESADSGWFADDFKPVGSNGPFLSLAIISARSVVLEYAPNSFVIGASASVFCLAWTVFALTRFGVLPSTRIVLCRLGRSQAAGLESDASDTHPDEPTGENARKRP